MTVVDLMSQFDRTDERSMLGIVVVQVGAECGDLAEVARLAASGVRAEDTVAPAPDHALVVAIADAPGIDAAVAVAERIRALIQRWSRAQICDVEVVSAGAAVTTAGESAAAALARAERALVQACAGAGGCTVARSITRSRDTPATADAAGSLDMATPA